MKILSIKYRMMLYSTIMIIAVVSILASVLLYYNNNEIWDEFDIRTKSITKTLSHDLQLSVLLEDTNVIKSMLNGVLKIRDVATISVFDKNDTNIITSGKIQHTISPDDLMVVRSDIMIEQVEISDEIDEPFVSQAPERIGSVEIIFSTTRLRQKLMEMISFVVLFTLVIILLRIISDYIFMKGVTTPLEKLVSGSEAVANGDLTLKIDLKSENELGKLAYSFNSMVSSLKDRDEEIKAHQQKLENNLLELELSHKKLDDAYRRLTASTKEVEEYKSVLEDRVKERTWELEQTNKQLTEAYKKIKEVDRLKSEFLTNMSHELRTPLNSIIGFSRVIMKGIDGPITEIQEKDLAAIYNSGQHLLGLINDVLDLSKIEAGKMELIREEINIPDLIEGVVSTFNAVIKEKSLKLTVNPVGEILPIKADRTRIRQVLLNIISNAVKFTSRGEITVSSKLIKNREIELIEKNPFSFCPKRTNINDDVEMVLISVKDTGMGIRSEDMVKVFETFQQIDSSSTRIEGGTGLGMSISHRIVEMHGGEIWIESAVGTGSTFHFTIPIEEHILVVADKPDKEESVVPSGNYKGLVVVIDDEIKAIELYKKILVKEGYGVVGIHKPERAIVEVITLKPDFIILDVLMPKKDGWELIQELKSNPMTKYIPVIFCTILSDKKLGMSLGATEYLMKPVADDDLLRALQMLDSYAKKIVVMDDNPKDAELIGRFLTSHGYRPIVAYNGKDGLDLIKTTDPQLVIVDLMMPKLDGFCVINELKKSDKTKNIPIIVLSAMDITKDYRDRLSGHVEKMLKKGLYTEEELMGNVIKTLEKVKK